MKPRLTAEERFDAKIDDSGPIPDGFTTPCWLWTSTVQPKGYGLFWVGAEGQRQALAHRWNYERHVGPIPAGHQIDHLCRIRNCVNPAHLEAVTPAENNRRSDSPTALNGRADTCKFGHPLTEDNLHPCYTRMGQRRCWKCVKQRQVEYRRRKKHQDS